VIGVADAETVVEHVDRHVTRDDLDAALTAMEGRLADRLTSSWRRDLVLVITGQFVALAGVLTAVA
jgi:hypothetical protein